MNYWLASSIAAMMGILWAGSFLAYAKAFHMIGSPAITLPYFAKLALTTPFVAGLVLGGIATLLRMWLFGQVGAQRTWFMEPVIFMVSTLVVVSILREGMKPPQWIGALVVTLGMFLLLRK